MNNKKEIEAIAKTLCTCKFSACEDCMRQSTTTMYRCQFIEQAKILVEAGIGDKKQAVTEFRDKFWNSICIELNDVLGKIPSLRIEVKQYIEYVLNNIFTELYGI